MAGVRGLCACRKGKSSRDARCPPPPAGWRPGRSTLSGSGPGGSSRTSSSRRRGQPPPHPAPPSLRVSERSKKIIFHASTSLWQVHEGFLEAFDSVRLRAFRALDDAMGAGAGAAAGAGKGGVGEGWSVFVCGHSLVSAPAPPSLRLLFAPASRATALVCLLSKHRASHIPGRGPRDALRGRARGEHHPRPAQVQGAWHEPPHCLLPSPLPAPRVGWLTAVRAVSASAQLAMYNYGSPRVGNRAFVDGYNRLARALRPAPHHSCLCTEPRHPPLRRFSSRPPWVSCVSVRCRTASAWSTAATPSSLSPRSSGAPPLFSAPPPHALAACELPLAPLTGEVES